MDDYNQNQNQNRHMNRNRHNRFGGHRGGGDRHGQHNRPRAQRPLLTSAINGAGLCLIAMMVAPDALKTPSLSASIPDLLALAVIIFGISSVVSYFAQRMKGKWVETISDVFFLAGAVLIIWMGLLKMGLV